MNKAYLTNEFLNGLYEKMKPEKNLLNCDIKEIDEVRAERIAQLRRILKLEEMEQMFGKELSYQSDEGMKSMGIHIDKYQVSALEGLDFPIYHIKPKKSRKQTVLYLHGHDDKGIVGALLDRTDKVRYHRIIPVKLAQEGYDVIAPELIGLGESGFYGFPKGQDLVGGCFVNHAYLMLAGFSLAGFRVFQSIKALDFIERLGLGENVTAFGISGGGMICQMISALEERIRKVIVACYANTYKNSTLYKEHCVDNYVPELLQVGDSYELLSLAAPKPMLTVNGRWDRAFPEAGSKIAFDYLEQVYERLGAADQYESRLIEGMHEIHEEDIIGWMNAHASDS